MTLNNKDLEVINNFLKDSQNEIVISNNESDVKKYKKEARISDDCSKEVFNSTDEKKIESKEYSKEEQNLIRSKLPIHHAIKIELSSLRLKPFRLITTILLSCISFIMLGTVSTMMFYNKTNVAANALNTKKPKTVTIQKEYEVQYKYNNSNSNDYSSRLMLTMFDDSELNNYKAKYGKSIPYFTLEENSIIPGENMDARSYSILEIKIVFEDNYYYNHFNAFIDDLDNPMIKNRLEYGSLPSKYDEITIPSYIADMIINSDNTIGESENSIKSRSDLIGKMINVTGCKYELSIVGIFNCDDLIDKKFEKLKKDYIEENVYSLRSEWANERLTGLFTKGVVNKDFYKINKKYNIEEKSVNLFTEDKSLNIFKFMKFKDGIDYYSLDGTLLDTLPDENIFIGQVDYLKYINNFIESNQDIIDKNEIVEYKNYVDSQNSKDLYYYYNINKYANTILNKYEGFNKIKFINNDGDEYDFEIKGFSSQDYEIFVDNITFDSLEETKGNNKSFIEYKTNYKLDSKAKYLGLIIDTSSYNYSDYKKLTSVHEKINTDYSSLSVTSYIMNVIDSEDSFIIEWKKVFLWTGIVLAVFSTLLLSNFISLSISNKKKEIGILRAVGARGSDVFKIFIAESLTIAIICSILALVGTAFVCYALNSSVLEQFGFAILVITFPTILLIFIIGILVAIFATLLPVLKIARKKPVDTIRSI